MFDKVLNKPLHLHQRIKWKLTVNVQVRSQIAPVLMFERRYEHSSGVIYGIRSRFTLMELILNYPGNI